MDAPHFDLPFRFAAAPGGAATVAAAVVEQDTTDDVIACVIALAVTPQGHRLSHPDFGLPDLTFRQAGDADELIAGALAEHEPRGTVQLVRQAITPAGDTTIGLEVAPRTDY